MKENSTYQKMHKSFLLFLIVTITLFFTLTGCGSNPDLENYKANMNQFFENVAIFDQSINAIDPESETSASDLLALLDSMDKSFAQMASLEVPEGFPGVDELALEASEYMTEAVSYYHQAFEGETFDPALADVAKQNYDRANLRIQYILSILHGDIPEEIYSDATEEDSEADGEPEAADEVTDDVTAEPDGDSGEAVDVSDEAGTDSGSAED